MSIKDSLKKFWKFLNEDTWQSWIVSLVLIVVIIKFIFFPGLSFFTGTQLPLVVVESCSMYHDSSFDSWWDKNAAWYESKGIIKEDFEGYRFKNGLSKGDIIFVIGTDNPKKGDTIIFVPNIESQQRTPIIHRIISSNPIGTKGDNNIDQLKLNTNSKRIDETNISQDRIIGKSIFRIPYLGWIKLIFFEPTKPSQERGTCSMQNH